MNPENQNLFTTLEALSAETVYSLVGDEPYHPFFWNAEKGEMTIEALLLDTGNLESLEPSAFFHRMNRLQSEISQHQYNQLWEWLDLEISELYLYNYEISPLLYEVLSEIPEQERSSAIHVPIILGTFASGESIGLCPQQNLSTSAAEPFQLRDFTPTAEIQAKIAELEQLIEELTYDTKLDRDSFTRCDLRSSLPLWKVVCTHNRSTLLEKLLESAGFLDIREINRFFRIDEEDEEDEDEAPEDKLLRQFLNSQLSHSRSEEFTFIVGGEAYTAHYVRGITPSGDWMGVTTISFTC